MNKIRQTYVLHDECTGLDDKGLKAFLVANGQTDVTIDASKLKRMEVGLVELLLTASRHWARSDSDFAVTGLSPRLTDRLDGLGLSVEVLICGAQA